MAAGGLAGVGTPLPSPQFGSSRSNGSRRSRIITDRRKRNVHRERVRSQLDSGRRSDTQRRVCGLCVLQAHEFSLRAASQNGGCGLGRELRSPDRKFPPGQSSSPWTPWRAPRSCQRPCTWTENRLLWQDCAHVCARTESSSLLVVIDTISRALAAAALAGVEIPTAHAAASKTALSTARERRISDCLRVSDCLGVIFFPPRTLHALAIEVHTKRIFARCHGGSPGRQSVTRPESVEHLLDRGPRLPRARRESRSELAGCSRWRSSSVISRSLN